MKAKPTPLIDAAGTRVERIRPDRVKKSTRAGADLAKRVGVRAELARGEDLQFEAPARLFLDLVCRLLRADVERVGQREVVRELVGELRGAGPADREGRDGRGSGADRKAAAVDMTVMAFPLSCAVRAPLAALYAKRRQD